MVFGVEEAKVESDGLFRLILSGCVVDLVVEALFVQECFVKFVIVVFVIAKASEW